jgi:hypothetical protein
MNPVSEGFLLTTAQIAATLIGLLLVGVLFFAETGLRRLGAQDLHAMPYLRAGVRWVLVVYSMVLGVSLALIAFEPIWAALVFALFGLAVIAALVSQTQRTLELARARPDWMQAWSAWLPWPPTFIILALPWILGGLTPGAEAFVITLLLGGAMAFISTASLVLLTLELSALDGGEGR